MIQEQSFVVLTYNVNFGICRKKSDHDNPFALNITQCIKNSKADVVFLQETNEAWEYAMEKSGLSESYNFFFHHRGAAGGAAMLSKKNGMVKVEKTEMIDTRSAITESWFEQMMAYGVVGTKKCGFLNVHLRPPKGQMAHTSKFRLEEIEFCLQKFEKGLPMFICGDFNENDEYSAVSHLKELEFEDGLSLVDKSRETMFVDIPILYFFNWRRNFRLDHIMFTKKDFILSSCEVIDGYREGASDHQPVKAEFKIA